jgi:hypothetical protein
MLFIGITSMTAQGVSSIAQGFQTNDANVVPGALVSLTKDSPNTVELSKTENLEQLIGVAGEQSLIELSNGSNAIQVVTNGSTPAIVSDLNGTIKTGDKITVSPIAGVGMKATVSTLIVGTAQDDLSKAATETRSITDKSGKKKEVHIGTIPIQVDKVFYEAPAEEASFLPPMLQDFANHIAGKQVSAVRVLIAALLVVFMFITVSVLLYSSIRSSIISIGRNPLSERAVQKSLIQVGVTVVGLLIFTVIIIYLILML